MAGRKCGKNSRILREFTKRNAVVFDHPRDHDCFLSSVPSPFLTRRAISPQQEPDSAQPPKNSGSAPKKLRQKKIVFLSAWTLDSISAARSGQIYWKDEPGDEESTQDSNDTIADVVEIDIGRGALEDAIQKS